ncbi:adenine phosphoribosyltransferase [Patescibacteria group bacterium]|nr:adenine phosphoribosyltransferase [Patescibacteria group bacterium]
MDLKQKIKEIPDWPEKGVNFKDITPLLQDKEYFKFVVDKLCETEKPDIIVGIDARGFIFASAMAYKMNTGLALIRKKGKLPPKVISQKYDLEYASNIIEMKYDSIKKGDKILIVDDVLATGGTMKATCDLIEKLQGNIIGISFLIELDFLKGREKLNYPINSLIHYES